MKTRHAFTFSLLLPGVLLLTVTLLGCEKDAILNKETTQASTSQRLDIGWDELMKQAEVTVNITPRSHGYTAEARGRGTVPSGEYMGQRFQITLEANYSDIGLETLIDGRAEVMIRSDRFESVMDTLLQSFCCGEGHLEFIEGEYIFTVYGQVQHSTDVGLHNHLFAGLASTAGSMNMNIADQTGSVVEPSDPPHDPGIGLIENFRALYVRVNLH